MSEAKCATGWGDGLSTRALFETRDCHPTPPLISIRVDPPPPGEGKKRRSRTHRLRIQISNSSRHSFAISPHVLREVCFEFPALSNQRAQGMPGARCAR